MRGFTLVFLATASISLPGCLAKTALDIATLPVKVASKGVDMATTSQSEADQKRGAEIRRREERAGKLERDYNSQLTRCNRGDNNACNEARNTYAELQQVLPTIPVEPEED